MSYKEESRERRASNFRTSMDIGMGLFYIAIGSFVIYAQSFGDIKIPSVIAYVLGGMMAIGGFFRFYRGLKIILPRKNDADTDQLN